MRHATRLCLTLTLPGILVAAATRTPCSVCKAADLSPEAVEFFESRIRPVLAEHCYECHSAKSAVLQGELRLDTAALLRKGGQSGAVVEPGKPGDSLLISA